MRWKDILFMVASGLFGSMTPELKKSVDAAVLKLYMKAKQTSNPFDDMAVGLLCALVGVVTPTDVKPEED